MSRICGRKESLSCCAKDGNLSSVNTGRFYVNLCSEGIVLYNDAHFKECESFVRNGQHGIGSANLGMC